MKSFIFSSIDFSFFLGGGGGGGGGGGTGGRGGGRWEMSYRCYRGVTDQFQTFEGL